MYHLGACLASMQDRPFRCDCWKPFSPRQAIRCRCCVGVRTVRHDVAADCGWLVSVERSAQVGTMEPADAHLQGDAALDPAFVNGKRVDFLVFDTSGRVACDITIVDPFLYFLCGEV
jgi:hypothetical protein